MAPNLGINSLYFKKSSTVVASKGEEEEEWEEPHCHCGLPLQGLMFGYATDETEESMPLTIILAHKLNAKMAELRRKGVLPWLRPDSKTQVAQRCCR